MDCKCKVNLNCQLKQTSLVVYTDLHEEKIVNITTSILYINTNNGRTRFEMEQLLIVFNRVVILIAQQNMHQLVAQINQEE